MVSQYRQPKLIEKIYDLTRKVFTRLRLYGELVMFSHTLFSLPFALVSIFLAADGLPDTRILFWSMVCLFAGRNGANAINRYIDHKIDYDNPRTRSRHIPSGRLRRNEALYITLFCYGLFVFGAAQINTLCLYLSPFALLLFTLYSYTKRFTFLCHIVLGIACAGAPMGAWLAVRPYFSLTPFLLSGAVALWVAGFDILYATQDENHDRRFGIHSIPAFFGSKSAKLIAFVMHMTMILLLFSIALLQPALGLIYLSGVGLALLLLIIEHRIKKISFAAYSMNQIISITYLVFTSIDIFLVY